MAVATMATFSASSDMAPMGIFVPSTPLVVKREKRRRRAAESDAAASKRESKRRAVRQGFVFDTAAHEDTDRSVLASAASSAPSSSNTFVFRVRKTPAAASGALSSSSFSAAGVDATTASEALLQKKERAAQRQLKQQRLLQKKAAQEKEDQFEAALVDGRQLSRDQLALYYAVRDQAKREMRKTMRDFARSAARADILQLTEKSLGAIKSGVAEFMTAHPPSQTMEIVANPENARLKALIESYEARIQALASEEAEWTQMKEAIAIVATASEETPRHAKEVALQVTTEIETLQRAALAQLETSAQRLLVIQDAMKSVDRLALQAEIQKSKLFDAFHGSAFKGYARDPKETLRALLKLAPPAK